MTNKHVIVAEDNRVLLDVIRFNLKRSGYQVSTAIEGGEALRQLEQSPIDLLITDCQMPGMSGLELCRIIRHHPTLHSLPILFCTAKGYEINDAVLNELSLPQIICKPFSPRELLAQVDAILQPAIAN